MKTTPASDPPVDAYVQRQIAGTNGNLYAPTRNRLTRYPVPSFPAPAGYGKLLLDVGCGWGRWMLAAARKGYVPIGIDIKLDAAQAARRVLRAHAIPGCVAVADLQRLPFKPGLFDCVFSYSVIQHVHRQRAVSCIREIRRVLAQGGTTWLEFPVRNGIGNTLRGTARRVKDDDDPDSWSVRYYGIDELESLFGRVFGNFQFEPDCYIGIGVQRSDVDILPWQYKPVVMGSELLKGAARIFRPLRRIADSIFVVARNQDQPETGLSTDRAGEFKTALAAEPDGNTALFHVLACPLTGCDLQFDADRQELVSEQARLAYPIVDGVPVLIAAQARRM